MDNIQTNTVREKPPVWKKLLSSSIFWLALLTLIYILAFQHYKTLRVDYDRLAFQHEQALESYYKYPKNNQDTKPLPYITPFQPDTIIKVGQFIGLFVPIGPQNFILFLTGIPLIVLAIGIALFEYIMSRNNFSLTTKIIGSLVMLFIVTFLLDVTLNHARWCSWEIFWQASYEACLL